MLKTVCLQERTWHLDVEVAHNLAGGHYFEMQ
jgi:hypothetical protein